MTSTHHCILPGIMMLNYLPWSIISLLQEVNLIMEGEMLRWKGKDREGVFI